MAQLDCPFQNGFFPGSIDPQIQVQVSAALLHRSREKRREQSVFLGLSLEGGPNRAGRVKVERKPRRKGQAKFPFREPYPSSGKERFTLKELLPP